MELRGEGHYDLQAPSGEQLTGRYRFDGGTGELRDQASGHVLGRFSQEPIGEEPLPQPTSTLREPFFGVLDSEVITAMQQPWNDGALFVVPARLNGTAALGSERFFVESVSQYCFAATGSARAQLAIHPAVGQLLLDSAQDPRGGHLAEELQRLLLGAAAGVELRVVDGSPQLHETTPGGGGAGAMALRSHLHSLRLLAVHGVPVCGLTPDLAGLSRESHKVSLVFAPALAAPPGVGLDDALQREAAQAFLAAQYYGAMRLAARPGGRRTKVYLMPIGTRTSGGTMEGVAAAMSQAAEMLSAEERSLLDVQALTWRGSGEYGQLSQALAQRGQLHGSSGSAARPYGPDGTARSGLGDYGPDGMQRRPTSGDVPHFGARAGSDEEFAAEGAEAGGPRHGVETEVDDAWFRAEGNREEQEDRGVRSVRAICQGVEVLWRQGLCPSRRWTNDRERCDPPGLPEEVPDFTPGDSSLYVPARWGGQGHGEDRPMPGDRVEVLQENDGGHFDAARVGTRGLFGKVLRDDGVEQGAPKFLVELRGGVMLWYEEDWVAPDRGRPTTGDSVRIYMENALGRYDPQRRGTRGRLGVVTKDYGPGPAAYDVALPDGRTLQYDEGCVAKVGAAPRVGDPVQVMVENPTGHFDENRVGTRGRIGEVLLDDGSDLPLLVQFNDGWSMYFAASWLRKVPPERLRVFLAPVEGESTLEEVTGDYTLDASQQSEGFPVWVKSEGESTHMLLTDGKGRWALTRAPSNHIVVVSRPHGGRYPQLVDQWGVLRLGTFIPIDLRVQSLSLTVLPGARVPRRLKSKQPCQPCCGEGPEKAQTAIETPEKRIWEAGEVDPSQQSHRRISSSRRWERLVDFGPTSGPGCSSCCSLFNETAHKTHCGRVFQGSLDNAYLVEALNAISLRPRLARRLFLAWSIEFSVFAVRLFKNGTWVCVEVDDWVPVPAPQERAGSDLMPFCCHSEHFPDVLWPSVVEKAYAKSCTLRDNGVGAGASSSGGWESLGGGGRVDEALADLTGGVASSFCTGDVSPDRLFVYLHDLQRDCLFVCRVNIANSRRNGIGLNPLAYHAVNRAVHHEGHGYVQIFCSHPNGVFSGGLDGLTIPHALTILYPERVEDGFFWLSILDFHFYFETIFECRLVNSPDVGIVGMPPPRLPGALTAAAGAPWDPLVAGKGGGARPLFFEHVFATAGLVTSHRPPEFGIVLPGGVPCEVVAVVEQTCGRTLQVGPERARPTAVLLKVYEHLRGDAYSSELVCKSAWKPVRGAMVAFKSLRGGTFKLVAEMGYAASCDRLIFRCYTSVSSATVTASAELRRHLLAQPEGPSSTIPWTLVGCTSAAKMTRAYHPTAPEQDLDELQEGDRESRCVVA
mmetsp:Transcript_47566/g.136782  ORF Transcript_47566/g.136782 Transcript_47566/m.136782 type:complete len:1366 (+) Transcript_47566:135-4232(+)